MPSMWNETLSNLARADRIFTRIGLLLRGLSPFRLVGLVRGGERSLERCLAAGHSLRFGVGVFLVGLSHVP